MVDRTKDEFGHWGGWTLDPRDDAYTVSMWVDRDVLMLRAVHVGHGDPIELNSHQAMSVAIALLERVRAIDESEGDDPDRQLWARVADLASGIAM